MHKNHENHENHKNIVLIGMPGCGKTTLGKKIANRLKMDFIDLDEYIEQNEDMRISEMFKISEEYFRNIEKKYVHQVSSLSDRVIATGGGCVKNAENMIMLSKNSIIIYINRNIEDIFNDIDVESRPLLVNNKSRLFELYDERHKLYEKYSNLEIKNDSDEKKVVERILEKIYVLLKKED